MNAEGRPQAAPEQPLINLHVAPVDPSTLPHLIIAGREGSALFAATDLALDQGWCTARGHWWRRTRGELGPERRYTWPRRQVLEIRWP